MSKGLEIWNLDGDWDADPRCIEPIFDAGDRFAEPKNIKNVQSCIFDNCMVELKEGDDFAYCPTHLTIVYPPKK